VKKLLAIISNKEQWGELPSYIELVEQNKSRNPNIALDAAKSILECISKTVLENKGVEYPRDSTIQSLVGKTFEQLPIFEQLTPGDKEATKRIIRAVASIVQSVGDFRNTHGFFSHGHDLHAPKFDMYLIELVVDTVDALSTFLIAAHSEDLLDRKRMFYEDYSAFNEWFDSNNETISIAGVEISPSRALFDQDLEAYKESFNYFTNTPEAIIDQIIASIEIPRELIRELQLSKSFTDDQIRYAQEKLKTQLEDIQPQLNQLKEALDKGGLTINSMLDPIRLQVSETIVKINSINDLFPTNYISEQLKVAQETLSTLAKKDHKY